PLAIDDIREHECAPPILGNPALKLPAHQRMQLAVLVDGAIDPHKQALRLQHSEMGLEIGWRRSRVAFFIANTLIADIEHRKNLALEVAANYDWRDRLGNVATKRTGRQNRLPRCRN